MIRLASARLTLLLFICAGTAQAAPAYQMPFACGETWRLATWDGHDPEMAVDMNRDGDAGDRVVAAAAGKVTRRRDLEDTSYGKYLVIDHGNNHNTLYAHLSAFKVSLGQSVRQGQLIGNVGASGTKSPHLHFEQRVGTSARAVVFNGVQLPYFGVVYKTSRNSCDGGGVPAVVDTAGAPLTVRSGPGTSYDNVGSLADGSHVTILCQSPGSTVNGTFGTSNIWDRIGTGRYIADAYVRTGSDGYVAPRCP